MKHLHIVLTALFVLAAGDGQANEALRTAARLGDTAQVRALLEAGADPNFERRSYSPLMFATGNGHAEMTRLLLARGAIVDHRDHNGDRALLWAARRGHVETVRMLLAAGAAVQSDDDPYQRTPLMLAASYARAEVVRVLLAAGADPRRRDHMDDTALHSAAISGNAEIIAMLLAAGGDPNVADRILRRTPVYLAASYGRVEAVRLLVAAGADHDARDSKGVSPFLAALMRDETVAWLLVELTRDIDRGFAAAVWSGYAGLARRLAERGADVNALDRHGRPAVAGVAQHPGTDMLAWFIANGVDLGRHGAAALHQAAASGRPDLARLLLDSNVPVNARDDAGVTTLLRAAGTGQVEVVRLLLARGAERNPRDRDGRGADAYMAMAVEPIEALIERRGMSRAHRPTEHLKKQLAELTAAHAAVRELLAQ